MPSSLWLTFAFAAAAAPSSPPNPNISHYRGLCEASGAAVIGPNRFAVASDESNAVRIYERGKPEPLADPIPLGDVDDLEGAARIGNRILWITSHSLTKKGKDKPERKQLIETSILGDTLVVGRRFADLRPRLAKLLADSEWPLEVSLNVEGLASTPGGDLLLGLRAPLKHEKAAVARIPNPLMRKTKYGRARLWWLDLGTRGVRSLERVGVGARAYLIVAGPTGEGNQDAALFWWDGASDTVTPGPPVNLLMPNADGLTSRIVTPEAAIRWKDGTIELLGDNEANCEEGTDGAWFPSVEIPPAGAS